MATTGRDSKDAVASLIQTHIAAWCELVTFPHEALLERTINLHAIILQYLVPPLPADYCGTLFQRLLPAFSAAHAVSLASTPEGRSVLLRALDIASVVANDTGTVFRAGFQFLLSLITQALAPAITNAKDEELALSLVRVVGQLLSLHWREFEHMPKAALAGPSGPPASTAAILQQLFSVLFLPAQMADIALMRECVATFEAMHKKAMLYKKPLYRTNLWTLHVNFMLDVCCNSAFNLLEDDIRAAVFSIASTDFVRFALEGVGPYMARLGLDGTATVAQFRTTTDAPSFSQLLSDFARDIAFHQSRTQPPP